MGVSAVVTALAAVSCGTAEDAAPADSIAAQATALTAASVDFVASGVALTPLWNSSASFGDFDGDGDLDLALIGSDTSGGYPPSDMATAEILRNDNGAYSRQIIHPQGDGLAAAYRGEVAWGDYDGDGRDDLLIVGGTGGTPLAIVYHNDGVFQGGLKLTATYAAGGYGLDGDGEWADFDGDGDLDVAYCGATAGGGGVTVVLRNDAGTFTRVTDSLIGGNHCELSFTDYDRDGGLDLFVATEYGSALYRYSDPDFVDSGVSFPPISEAWGGPASAWGDFDGDGDPDLVLAGMAYTGAAFKPLTTLYRNDGGRFFVQPMDLGDRVYYGPMVATGDIDGDGAVDLFTMGGSEWGDNGPVVHSRWYLNVGGAFSEANSIDVRGTRDGDMDFGDYDRDGDLDLIITGSARQVADPRMWERSTTLYVNQTL